MDYICPKCKSKMTSSKPLTYCVCGGKYEQLIDELFKNCGDIFDVNFDKLKKDKKHG